MSDLIPGCAQRFTATFTDPLNNDALADPDVVQFEVRKPVSGGTHTENTYTYNAPGSPIVRDSLGVYHLDVAYDNDGTWVLHVDSTNPTWALEIKIRVLKPAV